MSNSTGILNLHSSLFKNFELITSLTKREILGRYKGSVLGLLWSFFNPLLMLAVYTFVFGVVFKSKWPGGGGSQAEFALTLFAGLIIFNFFSECMVRAPSLIIGNINYVKKLIFPLEVLPVVAAAAAIFHFLVSFFVWVIFYLYLFGMPDYRWVYVVLIFIPLVLMVLGLMWFLSSLGVFLRDVSQIVTILVTILMFVTPLFYSAESLPEKYQVIMKVNPLSWFVEQTRGLLLWHKSFEWNSWVAQLFISFGIFGAGYLWFQKTRKGFADVL